MISILIPVFNAHVHLLVQELSIQLNNSGIEGEILVYDDFSDESFKAQNRVVSFLGKVTYKEFEKNYGRVAIRQLLGKDARYEWFLFIDSDSIIKDKNYLQNYLRAIKEEQDVYVGGRVYEQEIPAACNKRLHWKYGIERESVKGSSTAIHTNNFCIRKDLFLELAFPTQLTGYGHEDTWMQIQLEETKKSIVFLNNPVLHNGLEDTSVFLVKTKNALKNLLLLANIVNEKYLREKISLYNLFYWQRKLGLSRMVEHNLKKRRSRIEANLLSCNPSLLQFDLYRLYYLIEFSKHSI